MKIFLSVLVLALFLFGCTGSSDKTNESAAEETETVIVDESLLNLENASDEIIIEAEEIAAEIDSLVQNL